MNELAKKNCVPCKDKSEALSAGEKKEKLNLISSDWKLCDGEKKIKRRFSLKNFQEAMDLASKITEIAEAQWHHPELVIGFGKLEVSIWTHKIDDLVESDFILAAKIDAII